MYSNFHAPAYGNHPLSNRQIMEMIMTKASNEGKRINVEEMEGFKDQLNTKPKYSFLTTEQKEWYLNGVTWLDTCEYNAI